MNPEQPTPDQVLVDERLVKSYIAALKRPAKAFQYCHPNTITDLVSMLRELLRHRKLEHDHYWGEDDE